MAVKLINNNGYKYVTLNQDICDALDLDFGDYVKTTIKGKTVIISKTNPPTRKTINLDSQHSKFNNPHHTMAITENEIKQKILTILSDDQIKELEDLLSELRVSDHNLVVKVIRDLIDSNEITAKEEGNSIWFTLTP